MTNPVLYVFSIGKWRHKVGVANDPKARLATLQTGCPDDIEWSIMAESEDARRIERVCHRLLGERRIRGEWFAGALSDIDAAIDAAWLEVRGRLPRGDFAEGASVRVIDSEGGETLCRFTKGEFVPVD